MNHKFYRTLIAETPKHLSQKEHKKLILALLAPPDSKATWIKNKLGEWEKVTS